MPGILRLQIEGPEAQWKRRGSLDPGHPIGGGIRECSFLLPQNYVGKVRISAQLEIRPGVAKPVAWACEQELNPDGSITIDVKRHDDPAWRKGV